MTRIDSFGSNGVLIKMHFESYKNDKSKPEHSKVCELFKLYDDEMGRFYSELEKSEAEIDRWREQLDLAGIKAHRLYARLKETGNEVLYDDNLLRNRTEECECGPERLEFHLHHHTVEQLLFFLIIGTADQKNLKKMKKELGIND